MIQNPSKDLTVIVYNAPKSPRYIKLNKRLLRSLLIAVPALFVISITVSFLYSVNLKNRVNSLRAKEPKVIQDLKEQKRSLEQDIASNKTTISELTKKLTTSSSTSPLAKLGLFSTPAGMKDLTGDNLIRIEEVTVQSTDKKKIELKFNLLNNNPEKGKVSGHISVIQYQNNLLQFYPEYLLPENNLRLIFSNGESFTASRFRPVLASFSSVSNLSPKYKIYIFSKSGDLLFYKQVGPFNLK